MPRSGDKLSFYHVLDKLGEGGMGEVWRARDARLDRSVALKVLPPEVAGDASRRQRFEQEARALAALNHPNIVAIYDVGEDGGCAYLVSELVDGESLRSVILRGPLPTRRLLEAAGQIAEALAAAHALGIVHRDLKPENVMIARDGRVKVLDFGLAKQTIAPSGQQTATIALSEPGTVLGTVGYMSPEQVRGEPVDVRSDIFSFGCVLYEMAAGKQAFGRPSSAECMTAILRDDPPEIGASLPSALNSILWRCLEKRPERRFQSAADLAFALRAISDSSVVSAAAAVQPRRRSHLLPALAALAGAALFLLGFALRQYTFHRATPRFERLTFMQGRVSAARFDPHGQSVIYAASWGGKPGRIFLALPGSPESRDLGAHDYTRLASVSASGDLALLAGPFAPDGSGTLVRSPISGGQMRPLLENVRAADWSPDGLSLAVVRHAGNTYTLEYPVGAVLAKAAYPPLAIRVSPSGNLVAFTHYDQGSSVAVSVVDRAGKERLLGVASGQSSTADSGGLAWTPDGSEVWFRSYDTHELGTVHAMDLRGRRRIVARLPGRVRLFDIAPDGRALISTDAEQLGALALAPGAAAERDVSVLESSVLRGIAPDGRNVLMDVVGESGGPRGSIYLRGADGAPAVRLGDGASFVLSPDAKWVSGFVSTETDKRHYKLIPTGAGEERSVEIPGLAGTRAIVTGWLDEGRRFLVLGAQPGGTWRIFLWDSSTGTIRPLTPDGMQDGLAILSPDRRSFLARGPGTDWRVYPVEGGAARKVEGLTPHDILIGWRADEKSVFVVEHNDDPTRLRVALLDIATGVRRPWKEIGPQHPVDRVFNLFVTPDGRAYAYNYAVTNSDLYIAADL